MKVGRGSDDLLRFTERSQVSYPVVPGHEMAGAVHALGSRASAASQVAVGDRVMVFPWLGCSQCSVCDAGDSNYCSNGSKELGFNLDGGYADYVVVPHSRYVLELPDAIPYSTGAFLPCSGLTAYSALAKCRGVVQRVQYRWKREAVVVVVGLGGLGQWCLKLLPLCLGRDGVKVVGVDASSEKLRLVEESNMVDKTFLFSLASHPAQQAAKLVEELQAKPHVVLDFVNTSETFTLCVEVLQRTGVHVMVGLHGGVGELRLPLTALSGAAHLGNLTGSLDELRELVELVRREGVRGPEVREYPLSEAGQALWDLEAGLIEGRAVLNMTLQQ